MCHAFQYLKFVPKLKVLMYVLKLDFKGVCSDSQFLEGVVGGEHPGYNVGQLVVVKLQDL